MTDTMQRRVKIVVHAAYLAYRDSEAARVLVDAAGAHLRRVSEDAQFSSWDRGLAAMALTRADQSVSGAEKDRRAADAKVMKIGDRYQVTQEQAMAVLDTLPSIPGELREPFAMLMAGDRS